MQKHLLVGFLTTIFSSLSIADSIEPLEVKTDRQLQEYKNLEPHLHFFPNNLHAQVKAIHVDGMGTDNFYIYSVKIDGKHCIISQKSNKTDALEQSCFDDN